MQALVTWFQQWSEACTYAGECAPDVATMGPDGCYAAIATFAAICFFAWWMNERGLKRMRRKEAAANAAKRSAREPIEALKSGLGQMDALDRAARNTRAAA